MSTAETKENKEEQVEHTKYYQKLLSEEKFEEEWILENPKEFLLKVIAYLGHLEATSTRNPLLFAAYETDSNQSLFEELATKLDVAAIARSKTVGRCLLVLMRMIIDKRRNFLKRALLPALKEDKKELTMKNAVDYLSQVENVHYYKRGLRQIKATGIVKGEKTLIVKNLTQINLFDLSKVNALLNLIWENTESENEKEEMKKWCISAIGISDVADEGTSELTDDE